MDRLYTALMEQHLKEYRQMVFLTGPRQVGKTTCSQAMKAYFPNFHYLNWDNNEDRRLIISGISPLENHLGLNKASEILPLIVFDEIHKYRKWKQFLKGFFDYYGNKSHIIVTGSAKLNVYRRGGDSLMGRYFLYRCHPLTVRELLSTQMGHSEITLPQQLSVKKIEDLLTFGGFPEPFNKKNQRFSTNWQRLRKQLLLHEDIRQLEQIQNFAELEYLLDILIEEAGGQLNVAKIANQLNVAETTIHRWVKILKEFYTIFLVKPWYKNIRRSIRKTPKLYLWDWSIIHDPGKRAENFMASHLHKAVNYWTDIGLGEYELFYLRDKEKREVDFLVTKNQSPWFLVEVKLSESHGPSKNLHYYSQQLDVQHAFQVIYNMPYVDVDCFQYREPVIVPMTGPPHEPLIHPKSYSS